MLYDHTSEIFRHCEEATGRRGNPDWIASLRSNDDNTNMQLITKNHHAITLWLCLCLALVAGMVLVGGYTRLSGSGLSITEWNPIHGTIPPLNIDEWQEEFDAYRASPQYEKINKGMTLDEFKTIFWPEYWHRVLGRIIGIVFLFPLLFFAATRSISKSFFSRLTGIFALGGLQGLMGWVMVASGLVDNPYVSHIKLAMHLSLAFLIFALILWAILDVIKNSSPRRGEAGRGALNAQSEQISPLPNPPPAGEGIFVCWFTLLCMQIILGALLAGLHGGLVYNTWPDMNGQFLPDGALDTGQYHIENIGLIQFLHRKVAILLAVGFLLWWFYNKNYVKNKGLGKECIGVTLVLFAQFALGVLTLLHHVPLPLALMHQMTALLLFAVSVVLLYGIKHK